MDECQVIAVLLAIFIFICLIIHILSSNSKNGFVTPEAMALYKKSRNVLSKDNKISFTNFKKVTGADDVVQYDDIKKLWKDGQLTPENVQQTF